uniref:Uncharacterized protein n=1 Tax=Rhizophora mucronata TaxID=61149 RepID=A0A2P2KHM0_RHIMU
MLQRNEARDRKLSPQLLVSHQRYPQLLL